MISTRCAGPINQAAVPLSTEIAVARLAHYKRRGLVGVVLEPKLKLFVYPVLGLVGDVSHG